MTRRPANPRWRVWAAFAAVVVVAVAVVGSASRPARVAVDTASPAPSSPERTAGATTPSSRQTAPPTLPTTTALPPPATTAPASPPLPACAAGTPIDRRRLAQLLMIGLGTDPARTVAAMAARPDQPGGFFVDALSTDGLTDAVATDLRTRFALAPIVGIDEEGGRVERIPAGLPAAAAMAAKNDAEIRSLGARAGRLLASRGINLDFAPVVDIATVPPNKVIGDRAFGTDPAAIVAHAGAFAAGLRDSGVTPTFKHFPGHGRTVADSHLGPAVAPPLDELRRLDLLPYRQLLGHGPEAVMMGHLTVPGLSTTDRPTSINPAAYRLLRDDVGYDGFVITDDLVRMRAVTDVASVPAIARAAIVAGADMVLLSENGSYDAALDDLQAAVASGELTAARVEDALRHQALLRPCP